MIVRTEAVVLRSMDYGETSQIVTIFTRELGKISVLAKGALKVKSRFGASLQPMSYSQVVFYYKPTRTLQTLSESTLLKPLSDIGGNQEILSAGWRIVELTNALMQEEQQNTLVFNLLLQVLHRLDDTTGNRSNILPYFQLKFATVLGFSPAFDRNSVQQLPEEGGSLLLDTGEITLTTQGAGRRASRTALRAFAICARADLDTVMRMRLVHSICNELDHLIEAYYKYHVEDHYPSRSTKVIDRMFDRMNST